MSSRECNVSVDVDTSGARNPAVDLGYRSCTHPRSSLSMSIPDLLFSGFPPRDSHPPKPGAVSHRRGQS